MELQEPQPAADRKDRAQRQDRESGCGLRFANTQDAKNHQQNAEYEEPAPGFPDLLEASDEEIRNSGHCLSPFGHCGSAARSNRFSAQEHLRSVLWNGKRRSRLRIGVEFPEYRRTLLEVLL